MSDTDAPEPKENQDEQPEDQTKEDQTAEFHSEEHGEFVDALRFEQIHGNSAAGDKMVDRFDDVPLKVSIELGRINIAISEIVDLKEGSVIETRKLSGQPMEIMVNERLFGHGEVVVVGDNLAVRITDLKKPDLG